MRELFGFVFNMLTDPLGLPIDWYWEWIILAAVGSAAYIIAYRAVGDLYSDGWIDGSIAGSVAHWIVRLLVFIVVWAIIYGVIWFVRFITAHLIIVLSALGGMILTVAVVFIVIRRKRRD